MRSDLIHILFRVFLQTKNIVAYNSRCKKYMIHYPYIGMNVIYIYILSDFVSKNKTTKRPELMTNLTLMIKLKIISTCSVMTVVILN